MRSAIQVVWWIGLLGAVLMTLAILKEVALVLRALRELDELARMTRKAAEGIASNVATISKLDGLSEPVRELSAGTQALVTAAARLEERLTALGAAAARRRSP